MNKKDLMPNVRKCLIKTLISRAHKEPFDLPFLHQGRSSQSILLLVIRHVYKSFVVHVLGPLSIEVEGF